MNAPRKDDPGWCAPPTTIDAPPEARIVITATKKATRADGNVTARVYGADAKVVEFATPAQCVTPLDALCPGCRAVILHENPA
jgi:hypothetical protein